MPTALVCSTAFAPAARSLAKALGVPDLMIATIPHPISWSGLSREDISTRVNGVLDQVMRGLTKTTETAPRLSAGGRR